jgi:uncharacterized surface protein with fasciclin (FAS1) repeats
MKDITIFAPTNAAFDKAAATISTLNGEKVTEVLTFHVVKGVNFSTGLKDGQTLSTVQGEKLKVKIVGVCWECEGRREGCVDEEWSCSCC